jgi:protein-S-isoprenylcysteine O-methyltransferase Ste14
MPPSMRAAKLALLLSNVFQLVGVVAPAVLPLPAYLSAAVPRAGMALSLLYWLVAETLFRTKTAATRAPPAEDRSTAVATFVSASLQALPIAAHALQPYLPLGHVKDLHDAPMLYVPLMAVALGACALRCGSMAVLADSFSRALTVRPGQRLVRHGPYRYCRHPGYAANGLVFVSCAFLVSANVFVSAACALLFIFVWHSRMNAEEAMLLRGVEGYDDYMKLVPWRLVPCVY